MTVAVAVFIGAVATGWWVAPFAVATAAAVVVVAVLARRAFGGMNGDLLGAAEQIAEIAIMLIASGLAAAHPLWWT